MNFLKRLWGDDRGQSTTEYILILAVVVMVAMQFRTRFKGTLDKLLNKVDGDLNSFAGGGSE